MTEGIPSTTELFIQLRHITVGLTKLRGPLQCLLIGRQGSTFILLIHQDHRQIEMRECNIWPILDSTTVAGLRFGQLARVMVEEAKIDMGFHKGRS